MELKQVRKSKKVGKIEQSVTKSLLRCNKRAIRIMKADTRECKRTFIDVDVPCKCFRAACSRWP